MASSTRSPTLARLRITERYGFDGLIGILTGIVTFAWPAMTAIALLCALIFGISLLVLAFRLRGFRHVAAEGRA